MALKTEAHPVEEGDQIDSISLEKEAKATFRAVKPGLSAEDADWLANLPLEEQQRIFRKVDKCLVPMLALLYLILHLDRANIGNAKIEGLEASLGMSGTDYNIAVSVFFIGNFLCEVPSNMLLAKFRRPSIYMGTLVICWWMESSAVVGNHC